MTRIVLFAILALTLASPAASPAAAQVDPVARAMAAQALSVATEAAELTAAGGLGDFTWVVSVVGEVPTTAITG